MIKENPYPQPMLPNVDYQTFDENFDPLVELEYGVLAHYQYFFKKLERVLLGAEMIQVPELIVAHLCGYLGVSTTVYLAERAKQLEPNIIWLIKQHADFAWAQFNQFPVNSSVKTQCEKRNNLAQLRESSPGSIVAQTVRLGRVTMDIIERLGSNRQLALKYSYQKQEALFCPQEEFFAFLIPLVNEQHHEWRKTLNGKSTHYAINQFAIQIAWLIGYFSHLDKQASNAGRYLEYGLPCIELYREYTDEFLRVRHSNDQILTSMQMKNEDKSVVDPEIDTLLHEIRTLSSKTHADLPPAITPFQKQTTIVQAGIEKLIIELMIEGMAVKVVLMSVFYFWFTLDAPLRVDDPTIFDDYSPFEAMSHIIDLVKTTVRTLPEPKLSSELKLLNAKMQALKSNLPDPASLDEVDRNTVAYQSDKVNTAIHTLTSEYLKQDYHVEAIANVLFSQWMHLSVFYGVSESDWQKMDYYLVEILTAVRAYIPTIITN